MKRNRSIACNHRRLGLLGQALFGGGDRVTRQRNLHITAWFKKKRTPRKKTSDNLIILFKKKRTPRLKKINCNLLKFFSAIFPSTNYAVLNSETALGTIEDYDFVVCAKDKITLRNQGAESNGGFSMENVSKLSVVQSHISLQDVNLSLHQEQEEPGPIDATKSIGSVVQAQREEISHGESQIKRFPRYAQEKNLTMSYPSDVKSLLATGLLEGFPVKYKKKKVEINGYIRGTRYLCGCSSCNYTQDLTAFDFEKHSGMSSHNQNNSIYLHCGTNISLYKLVSMLKIAPLKPLDKLVEEIIQCPPNLECYEKWKASQNKSDLQANIDNTQHCQKMNHQSDPSQDSFMQPLEGKKSSFLESCVETSACLSFNFISTPSSLDSVTEGYIAAGVTTSFRALQNPTGNATYLAQDFPMILVEGSEPLASGIGDSNVEKIKGTAESTDVISCSSTQTESEGNANLNQSIATKINHSETGIENGSYPASLVPIELISSALFSEGSTHPETKLIGKLTDSGMEGLNMLPATEETMHVTSGHSVELSSLEPAIKNGKYITQSACSNLTSEMQILEDLPSEISTGVALERQLDKFPAFGSQSELDKTSDQLLDKPGFQYTYQSTRANNKNIQSMVIPASTPKKRDNELHQLVFEANNLPDGSKLTYCNKGQELKTGYKRGKSIVCDCCETEMSPSQFEAHAGCSQRRQPYRNIYTAAGETLHELSIRLSDEHSTSPSSSQACSSSSQAICIVCGNRVCSEGEFLSNGKLHCSLCKHSHHSRAVFWATSVDVPSRITAKAPLLGGHRLKSEVGVTATSAKKFSETFRGNTSAKLRISRVLSHQTDELLCCSFCKDSSFSLEKFDEKTEIFCKQCEREYHIGCLKDYKVCDLKEIPQSCKWICSKDCNLIHDNLRELSNNIKHAIPVSLLKMSSSFSTWKDFAKGFGAEVQWQILSGINLENKKPLDMTISFFQRTFYPILDRGQDLISAMVYAKDVAGRSFGGMYCPMITVKSDIVSAGLLRVFGRCIAELPLIATLHRFRGKGYFRILLMIIEGLLSFLNVEHLLVSATQDSQSLWMQKLGFVPITEDRLQSYLKNYPLLMFENSVMLEKPIKNCGNIDISSLFSS